MEIKGKLLDTEDVDGMRYKFKISAVDYSRPQDFLVNPQPYSAGEGPCLQ
jgi:hypothetical protein